MRICDAKHCMSLGIAPDKVVFFLISIFIFRMMFIHQDDIIPNVTMKLSVELNFRSLESNGIAMLSSCYKITKTLNSGLTFDIYSVTCY